MSNESDANTFLKFPMKHTMVDPLGFHQWLRANPFQEPVEPVRKTMTLALDLDDTLIHSWDVNVIDADSVAHDFTVEDSYGCHNVLIRPGALQFLSAVRPFFGRIVLYTQAIEQYACACVQELEKQLNHPGYFDDVFHREHCDWSRKDLSVVSKDLGQVFLIDDRQHVLCHTQANSMLWLPPFVLECPGYLADSVSLVKHLSQQEDVRVAIAGFKKIWADAGYLDKRGQY